MLKQMLRKRTTFQEIAVTTITIAGVAVLSITYALLNVNADALKRSARDYAVSVAENVAYRISYEVEGFENAVDQIINVFSSPGISTEDKIEMAKAIMVLESVDFIAVFDKTGKRQDVISSGKIVLPDRLPDQARETSITLGRYYSLVNGDKRSGKLGILIPWVRRNEIFAFLYTEMDLSGISSYIKDISLSRLGAEDLVCVFDRAGNTVLPLDERRQEFLKSVLGHGFVLDDPTMENVFGSNFIATHNYTDKEKGKMLGALISMPELAWAVFIQQPYDVVYWSLGRMRRLSILVGVLSLCFAILLAFLISRYITRSIAKLIYGVRQVANRNFTFKVDIHAKNEIGELADTFNQMVDELNLHRNQIEKQQRKLELLAQTDALTGLSNHRHFMEELTTEVQRAVHSGSPLSVMILDLDDFKRINDTYGHLIGDRVLLMTAEIIKKHARSTDIIARYGGDEFCVALTNTTAPGARALAHKIREEISGKVFAADGSAKFQITCSIGLTQFHKDMASTLDILKLADQALYNAKKAGRNEVKEKVIKGRK
ncbi:MAG: diguanylate cyclase [candidate division WOR-3 bacterium]|nr:MAG: diguanylate cyclase [candidate division WOR-3 bacterium]